MRKELLSVGLLVGMFLALAVSSAFLALEREEQVAQGSPFTTVGIDVDPMGNTATSLGAIDPCVSVAPGQQFDIDVFLDEVPSGRDLASFNYRLHFDDTRVNIMAQDHELLLASAPGSSLSDSSHRPVSR